MTSDNLKKAFLQHLGEFLNKNEDLPLPNRLELYMELETKFREDIEEEVKEFLSEVNLLEEYQKLKQ